MMFQISVPPLILFFFSISGVLSSNVITLASLEIFDTHEWFFEPTVYFHCQGENKTTLPDVKKTDLLYNFTGDESWQPLIELPEEKCKRCGFYEKDTLKADDVYDEWELCPGDFVDGKYTRFKEKEFNATFLCPQCTSGVDAALISSNATSKEGVNVVLVIIICILASVLAGIGIVAAYKYWQKRKREQDQARFLKLFEEGDDIEDELELGL